MVGTSLINNGGIGLAGGSVTTSGTAGIINNGLIAGHGTIGGGSGDLVNYGEIAVSGGNPSHASGSSPAR